MFRSYVESLGGALLPERQRNVSLHTSNLWEAQLCCSRHNDKLRPLQSLLSRVHHTLPYLSLRDSMEFPPVDVPSASERLGFPASGTNKQTHWHLWSRRW
jgi:hypothetical protein